MISQTISADNYWIITAYFAVDDMKNVDPEKDIVTSMM